MALMAGVMRRSDSGYKQALVMASSSVFGRYRYGWYIPAMAADASPAGVAGWLAGWPAAVYRGVAKYDSSYGYFNGAVGGVCLA